MARWLIILGVVLLLAGLLWPWLGKLGLGRLPGDVAIERENLSPVYPDHDVDPDQPRRVADPVAAEPLTWRGGLRSR